MKQLNEFEQRLAEILGSELARNLIQYARASSPLEAQLLQGDGVEQISSVQRYGAMALIAEFSGRSEWSDSARM